MKISKLAMVVLLMVTILCMGVAVADPVGPNSTGNPSHDDDWGGGCSGQGNYGSGQIMAFLSMKKIVMAPIK